MWSPSNELVKINMLRNRESGKPEGSLGRGRGMNNKIHAE